MKPLTKFAFLTALFASVAMPVGCAHAAKSDAPQKPKWSVEAPPGEPVTARIDVCEGTWMSLDVASDGREIVFDLLGDLYSVPIDGGDAKPLTSGMAWDMQPRISPDGKWIAFTSDRGGGDNLWLMPRAGGAPTPVTSESVRLLSSPVFTPDGEFIVGRKHLTASRSLGTGELWLYHRSGGEGIPLTTKVSDEKDWGEPAFSPDGRTLYYSRDITSGEQFEYNKDPHTGIYAIFRLDRASGRIEKLIGGVGGAVRPTPSPSGTHLAYVRRLGEKTALFTLDLRSGTTALLDSKLDRDMQETWAIHGVYPTMAWLPDSSEVVYWARGGIQRVSIATGEKRAVPFCVKGSREMRRALRFQRPAAPAEDTVRMVRTAAVSPDGSRVVFEALGRLWIQEHPSGQPTLLTADTERFEMQPTWTPDGTRVVYIGYSDAELSRVRVVTAKPGSVSAVLFDEPGHYVEPTVSPDGATVVFRRTQGGWLTSGTWAGRSGLYRIPLAGGSPTHLVDSGSRPHFGADPSRVFFMAPAEKNKRSLQSVGLDGREPRTHLTSEHASEIRVSPDSEWVATAELSRVFVAPFPEAPLPFGVTHKTKSLPVRVVAQDAGWSLHWSGDSSALRWVMGPAVFTRKLQDSFEFLPGAPSAPLPPEAKGSSLRVPIPRPPKQPAWALDGARVVTMRGDEVLEGATIVVQGDRITYVGPREGAGLPDGARRIDAAGRTVIPGLIDVHAHGAQAENGFLPQQSWQNAAVLAFGVTTIHDPSNSTADVFAASELQRAGRVVAPRIFSTGTILYGANLSIKAEIDNLDDARSHLRRMKAVGAFSVKSYNQPRRDQRQQVLTAARELEMLVVPEGGSTLQHNLNMVVDGHTGIEHALPIAKVYADVIQLFSQSEVGYTPTLGVAYGGLFGENYWYQEKPIWDHPRLSRFVPPFVLHPRARRPMTAPLEEWNHMAVARGCKALHDAGVAVQTGAHGQREGLAMHWEMWMLEQGGFTPMEALRAATLRGAEYLGLQGDLGSIEAGKLADFAVIEGDPLSNLRDSERVSLVAIGGVLYDAATLERLHPEPAPRRAFFWELDGSQGLSNGRGGTGHTGCAGCSAH